MDDSLEELLGVNQRGALEFFFAGLRDAAEGTVDREELLYNASVLAHYAQVSTVTDTDFPAPANLGFVFDHFVMGATLTGTGDSATMEVAGAQCLLLAGFFQDQLRGRFNIQWYATLGAGFFQRAAAQERVARKAVLLAAVGRHFEPWRQTHARLGRELRERPYLLKNQ